MCAWRVQLTRSLFQLLSSKAGIQPRELANPSQLTVKLHREPRPPSSPGGGESALQCLPLKQGRNKPESCSPQVFFIDQGERCRCQEPTPPPTLSKRLRGEEEPIKEGFWGSPQGWGGRLQEDDVMVLRVGNFTLPPLTPPVSLPASLVCRAQDAARALCLGVHMVFLFSCEHPLCARHKARCWVLGSRPEVLTQN